MAVDFRKTTDELFDDISHQDLADALGVSVASIRQARLGTDAKAHRKAPDGWEAAIRRLAKQRAERLQRLVEKL